MEFEWDETKRAQVIKDHDVDLLHAANIFFGEVVTRIDDRKSYGEMRLISIGLVDGECFVVVHTPREGVTRLITAWKGGRYDRAEFETRVARRNQQDEGPG